VRRFTWSGESSTNVSRGLVPAVSSRPSPKDHGHFSQPRHRIEVRTARSMTRAAPVERPDMPALSRGSATLLDPRRLPWSVGTNGCPPPLLMRSGSGCGRGMRPIRLPGSWGGRRAPCVPIWCVVGVSDQIRDVGPLEVAMAARQQREHKRAAASVPAPTTRLPHPHPRRFRRHRPRAQRTTSTDPRIQDTITSIRRGDALPVVVWSVSGGG
jgi:hypothetical protein